MAESLQKKQRRVNEKLVIQALKNAGGFINGTAAQLQISPQSLCNKIAASKKLQQARDEIRESYLDLAETKLIEAVNAGAPWAICFYLKCQGKKRGYVEQQNIKIDADINFFEGVRKAHAELEAEQS